MPGMDGFEVCRKLKAEEGVRDIPVVFLTALRTDRESRILALEIGAEAFLSKPPNEQELVAQIRTMVRLKAATRLRRLDRDELAALVAERTRELEHELTERKIAGEALVLSENMLRESQRVAGLGSYTLDVATGRWSWKQIPPKNPGPVCVGSSQHLHVYRQDIPKTRDENRRQEGRYRGRTQDPGCRLSRSP